MSQSKKQPGASRRGFLKATAAAMAVAGMSGIRCARADDEVPTPHADSTKFTAGEIPKGTTIAPGRVIGANDRIRIAVIGVGGQGFGAHVKGLKAKAADNNIELVGCSDVYQP